MVCLRSNFNVFSVGLNLSLEYIDFISGVQNEAKKNCIIVILSNHCAVYENKKKKSHFVFYELPSDACIIRHNAPQCLLTEMNTQHQNNVHHIQLIAAPNLSLLRHRRCRRVHVCLRVKKKPAHDGAYSMSVDRGTYSRHSYEGTAHTLFK